jgi:hypothetical protein
LAIARTMLETNGGGLSSSLASYLHSRGDGGECTTVSDELASCLHSRGDGGEITTVSDELRAEKGGSTTVSAELERPSEKAGGVAGEEGHLSREGMDFSSNSSPSPSNIVSSLSSEWLETSHSDTGDGGLEEGDGGDKICEDDEEKESDRLSVPAGEGGSGEIVRHEEEGKGELGLG